MKSRRMIAVIVVIMLSVCTLVGCLTESNPPKNTDNLQPITVGSDNYPPFNFLDENGSPTGIDVEITTEAFRRIGYEPTFTFIKWEDKDILLEKGEIDCVAGCFTMTGRENQYNWAGPYMKSRQVVAVNPSSDITSLADLEGKVVAVQATTRPEQIFLQGLNSRVPNIKSLFCFEDRALLYPSLGKGYIDAIALHETSILQYEQDYGMDFRILDEPLLEVDLGVAFYKEDDRGIAERMDEVLDEMHRDGTLKAIIEKYLDDPEKYLGGGLRK